MQKKIAITSSATSAQDYHRSFGFTFILNAFMCASLAVLIAFYIVRANNVSAQTYQIKMLSQQLNSVQSANTELLSQRSDEDPISLAQFAQAHNMVPANDAIYLSERGNVALR